jgi:hypothetical protein
MKGKRFRQAVRKLQHLKARGARSRSVDRQIARVRRLADDFDRRLGTPMTMDDIARSAFG